MWEQWVPAVLDVRAGALGSVGVDSVGVGTVGVAAIGSAGVKLVGVGSIALGVGAFGDGELVLLASVIVGALEPVGWERLVPLAFHWRWMGDVGAKQLIAVSAATTVM